MTGVVQHSQDHPTRSRRPPVDEGDAPCCFCAELANERTEVHDLYPEIASRLVLETDAFVAMPSLGQLAPGHLLLVPREHVTSFGELDAETRRAAQGLYDRIRAVLSREFSPVLSFEHGSPPGSTSGGCGIVHAHIHFVPIGGRPAPTPSPVGTGWKPNENSWFDEAADLAERGEGYLMWHPPGGPSHVEAAQTVESQHLRRYVAGLLGSPDWNWRTVGPQREFTALVSQNASLG